MSWASSGDPPRQMCIACPACGRPALFILAEETPVTSASLRAELAAMREVTLVRDATGSERALYRHGLGGRPIEVLRLADGTPAFGGYRLVRTPPFEAEGSSLCDACGTRRPYRARWPGAAFYQIEHRGQMLWAWDRAGAVALAAYVAQPDSVSLSQSPQGAFLKRVPTHFLTAGAREDVARKLRRKLDEAAA